MLTVLRRPKDLYFKPSQVTITTSLTDYRPWTKRRWVNTPPNLIILPFRMDIMIEEGKITIEESEKYMQMLNSSDPEMEQLAITILRKLRGYD